MMRTSVVITIAGVRLQDGAAAWGAKSAKKAVRKEWKTARESGESANGAADVAAVAKKGWKDDQADVGNENAAAAVVAVVKRGWSEGAKVAASGTVDAVEVVADAEKAAAVEVVEADAEGVKGRGAS